LIEHFKELKHQGMKMLTNLFLKGTTDRLVTCIINCRCSSSRVFTMVLIFGCRGATALGNGGSNRRIVYRNILTMVVLPICLKFLKEYKKAKLKKQQKPLLSSY
jgi:cobalt-zinc-cadmium resistance protein CzcA